MNLKLNAWLKSRCPWGMFAVSMSNHFFTDLNMPITALKVLRKVKWEEEVCLGFHRILKQAG